jgi:hypothetical protein
MAFAPNPGDSIDYKGSPLFFVQHPGVKEMPCVLREEGKRGTVYQLSNGKEKWALKVFKKFYRKPHQLEIARKLRPLVDVVGLRAARRAVFEEGHPLVAAHPDLLHAQMMPWVDGFTWFNVLNVGGPRNGTYLDPSHAARLAHRFSLVMGEIERRGLAHTDIASGNVIVDVDSIGVELIDLEEMFGPDFPRPARLNAGSAGYGHRALRDPSSEGLWSAECDRFAVAILAAEMLIVSAPELSAQCDKGGGYFSDDELHTDSPRYRSALDYLRRECPPVAELFQRAWESPSIATCATAAQWLSALEPIAAVAPATAGPGLIPRSSSARWQLSHAFRTVAPPIAASVAPSVAPPPVVEGVSWGTPVWSPAVAQRGREALVPEAPEHREPPSEAASGSLEDSAAWGPAPVRAHASTYIAPEGVACSQCGVVAPTSAIHCFACGARLRSQAAAKVPARQPEIRGAVTVAVVLLALLLFYVMRRTPERSSPIRYAPPQAPALPSPPAVPAPAPPSCVATRHGSFHLRSRLDIALDGPEYPTGTQVRVFEATNQIRSDERLFRVQIVLDGQTGWAFVREDELNTDCGWEVRRPMRAAVCYERCTRVGQNVPVDQRSASCFSLCETDPTRFGLGGVP